MEYEQVRSLSWTMDSRPWREEEVRSCPWQKDPAEFGVQKFLMDKKCSGVAAGYLQLSAIV